jgi:hypothetical protein
LLAKSAGAWSGLFVIFRHLGLALPMCGDRGCVM